MNLFRFLVVASAFIISSYVVVGHLVTIEKDFFEKNVFEEHVLEPTILTQGKSTPFDWFQHGILINFLLSIWECHPLT